MPSCVPSRFSRQSLEKSIDERRGREVRSHFSRVSCLVLVFGGLICGGFVGGVEAAESEGSQPPAQVLPSKGESPVYAWNMAVGNAVRRDCTAAPLASRQYAILHLALEAAESAEDGQVVAAIAGGEVASRLFPEQSAYFEKVRESLLADLPAKATPAQWTKAHEIVASVLQEREGDGATKSVTYIPHAEPGQWRRTAPFFRPPELPNWAVLKSFSSASLDAFIPAGPPALSSKDWEQAAAEVRELGSRDSKARSDFQKESAVFWSDFNYTCTPPGHWNEIAVAAAREHHLSDRDAAHLLSLLNTAMADAGIVCWKTKYKYNAWRPITAFSQAGWLPLLNTPNHPEYPSGHSAFSGAACEVLTAYFGTDACNVTIQSDTARAVVRTYHSFSALAREISESRIYGGIHFRFSCEDGLTIGRSIADEVLRRRNVRPASNAPRL